MFGEIHLRFNQSSVSGGVRDDVIQFAKLVREHAFGPLHPAVSVFKWMENTIRRRLPLDAHKLATGRLCISMTRVPDGKNVSVSEFHTEEDLIKVCGTPWELIIVDVLLFNSLNFAK